MAARGATLAARDQGCACRTRAQPPQRRRSPCGRVHRQTQCLPTARKSWPSRHLEPHGLRCASSIPIARRRPRGRFSPTGSFAYRPRRDAASIADTCAPRPPGKRLSALKALHSDPLLSFAVMPRVTAMPPIAAGGLQRSSPSSRTGGQRRQGRGRTARACGHGLPRRRPASRVLKKRFRESAINTRASNHARALSVLIQPDPP